MGRNHSKAVTSRRNPGTRKVNKVILYCEGRNTEPSYFELLKKNNCTVVPVIVRGHGIGSCKEFVEEANKKYNCLSKAQREKYGQKWLVYDCDGHEDFADSVKVKPYDSQSKTVGEDFFDLMMAIHPETHHSRIEDAYYRAKTIHETKKAQGAEFKESVTTMYELMKELGVVKEPEQDEGEG